MRVRLADVGDIAPIFGPRTDARARSLRRAGSGGGGGSGDGGGTDDGGSDDDTGDDTDDKDGDDSDDDDSDDDSDDKDDKTDPELQKAIRRRDRALREKRALEKRVKELEADKDKDKEPDPVEVANTRLIRQAVRTSLAAAGVTEKEDQRAVLDFLRLDGISVDDDGVDEDEIEERIEELRRIFGGTVKKERKRTPRVDTRDRGGSGGETTDPDKARYRRIIGGARTR